MNGFSDISTTPNQPVLGIYVNNGTTESALREVIHGQVHNYENDGLPGPQSQTSITDGSNSWFYDPSTNILYADFGGTLVNGDPNTADISVLYQTHLDTKSKVKVLISLSNSMNDKGVITDNAYFTFTGLTLRASSWGATYSESNNIIYDHCDFKFNGGAGMHFGYSGSSPVAASNNVVQYSRVWMNVHQQLAALQ